MAGYNLAIVYSFRAAPGAIQVKQIWYNTLNYQVPIWELGQK